MSHVCATTTEIPETQLDSLKEACKQLGLTFMEGQKTYAWYGKWVNDYSAEDAAYKNGIQPEDYGKCIHAIKVPGSNYEIGVYKHPETGNLRLIYDFFGTGREIMKKVGKSCEVLWNKQGEVWATNYAKKNKLKMTKRAKDGGVVEYVFTR